MRVTIAVLMALAAGLTGCSYTSVGNGGSNDFSDTGGADVSACPPGADACSQPSGVRRKDHPLRNMRHDIAHLKLCSDQPVGPDYCLTVYSPHVADVWVNSDWKWTTIPRADAGAIIWRNSAGHFDNTSPLAGVSQGNHGFYLSRCGWNLGVENCLTWYDNVTYVGVQYQGNGFKQNLYSCIQTRIYGNGGHHRNIDTTSCHNVASGSKATGADDSFDAAKFLSRPTLTKLASACTEGSFRIKPGFRGVRIDSSAECKAAASDAEHEMKVACPALSPRSLRALHPKVPCVRRMRSAFMPAGSGGTAFNKGVSLGPDGVRP